MTEEIDVTQPGSLFMATIREPDIWTAANARTRMEIAKDWAAIGSPMPTAEDRKRLSPAEQRSMTQLLKSLHTHSMANIESETASIRAEMAAESGSRQDNRKPRKELDVRRDERGRLLNAKVF